MIRAVLFDFDGTLIDTWRLYLESFRRALEPHVGRLLSDEEILALKPTAERRLLERVVDRARLADSFAAFLAQYVALHETHCDGLYPGVSDMLQALRADGYRIGIVTGKSRSAWEATWPHCALHPFDVVVTDDDVRHPKPHAEGIQAALEALGVEDGALFVGDSLLDCQAAHQAGIPFGAALWSKPSDEWPAFQAAVTAMGPCSLLSHPTQVLSMVQQHGRVGQAPGSLAGRGAGGTA